MSDQYPHLNSPYGSSGSQSSPGDAPDTPSYETYGTPSFSSDESYLSSSADPFQSTSPYSASGYETAPGEPSAPSYESVFESTQRAYEAQQASQHAAQQPGQQPAQPAYGAPAEPIYSTQVFEAAAPAAPAHSAPAAEPVYHVEHLYQQQADPGYHAAAAGAVAGAAAGARGGHTEPAVPSAPSPFDTALGSARGVAADGKGFLPALFDFSFTHFVTPKLVRFVYLLATIGLGVTWLLFLFSAFSQGAGFGLIVLVLGPVLLIIYLALIRMTLEFYLSITRMSEDINRRLPQA